MHWRAHNERDWHKCTLKARGTGRSAEFLWLTAIQPEMYTARQKLDLLGIGIIATGLMQTQGTGYIGLAREAQSFPAFACLLATLPFGVPGLLSGRMFLCTLIEFITCLWQKRRGGKGRGAGVSWLLGATRKKLNHFKTLATKVAALFVD